MYLLLAFAYQQIARHTPPLVFLKAACHTNPGAVRKRAGSSSYISKHIF